MFMKFLPKDHFKKKTDNYFLLPFRFERIEDKELIVNDLGDYIWFESGTVESIVNRKIDSFSSLYKDLLSKNFISETPVPENIEQLAIRFRTQKSFLDKFTSLHIFVITLRCNHTCHYCQVSRKPEYNLEYDISDSNLDKAISLMFKSPSNYLTVEFQGGEPLLAESKIKFAVERIKKINVLEKRNITFVVCTNITLVEEDFLFYCKENDISISTSYDGPQFIHDKNRFITKQSSHDLTLRGIELCRKILGYDSISPLMTTSQLSLEYPVEIINDYLEQEFTSIFLREINPFGFAKKSEKLNLYNTEKFISFFKTALDYILELNKKGTFFIEEFTTVILSKILTPFPVGFTDLQSPNGAINNVIVYNHDGYVYASDESRMLAEDNDNFFRLGHMEKHTYHEIFYGKKAHQIAENWANECIAGCSDCAFQPFCGADPIRNYSTQNDMYGFRPTNSFCAKNKQIIKYIFQLLEDPINQKIFRSWVVRKPVTLK
ncbi:MAG: His-Xaa-Ser system radical SAM maturase HxsB [Calditrichaeota bacterium]|nr:MAG: His-Xaa-Ser system radical SAM maturase HxsB [Calditrichota bacterium]MBL1208058.1 His-Xaa-Ser system radical SAM maturase HxsB [Calditrichota bacterium]NOG47894.1 His-Xaa-Ser system radical SAM maturase HxsB [Calditrichota bacterium]